MLLADLPDVLTIEEAAAVLRISRGAAYQLAHEYLWSGGHEGLPVFRLGRRLRVPKAALVRLLAAEPRIERERGAVEGGPWPGRLRSV